jgi:hypothetical protein
MTLYRLKCSHFDFVDVLGQSQTKEAPTSLPPGVEQVMCHQSREGEGKDDQQHRMSDSNVPPYVAELLFSEVVAFVVGAR